jgi:hypothetical protein
MERPRSFPAGTGQDRRPEEDPTATNVHRDTTKTKTTESAEVTPRGTPTKARKNKTIISYSDRFIPSRCVDVQAGECDF